MVQYSPQYDFVFSSVSYTNLVVTEHEGCTRKYWSEVVTTEGQYSPLWLKLARLVSSL